MKCSTNRYTATDRASAWDGPVTERNSGSSPTRGRLLLTFLVYEESSACLLPPKSATAWAAEVCSWLAAEDPIGAVGARTCCVGGPDDAGLGTSTLEDG